MKLSEGVEWAAHACAILAALPTGRSLNVAALAEYHELPRAYLAKHLQALAKAGLLRSARGAHGGYSLARPASQISLWDIRAAIEGVGPDFRCHDIRRRGPCAARCEPGQACEIAAAFWEAERGYREKLGAITVASIARDVARRSTPEDAARFFGWLETVR